VERRKVRDLKDLVDVAMAAAARAARLVRQSARPTPSAWTEKTRHDFATDVDRAAETLVAETLTTRVPGSRVLGEELSPSVARDAEVVWIVDPLDGTTNFLHGYPQYAVSIGCTVGGALCVGVVHDVARELVYHAAAGLGAWQGERRLAVSTEAEPRRALVGTGFPFKQLEDGGVERYLRQLAAVVRATSGVRRAGAAALDLVDVADGRFDAFWELTLAPWDVAAGVVLVREAGGVVTTIEGSAAVLDHGSLVAGNPPLHHWLRELLRMSE